jgi:hypothetical protein
MLLATATILRVVYSIIALLVNLYPCLLADDTETMKLHVCVVYKLRIQHYNTRRSFISYAILVIQ